MDDIGLIEERPPYLYTLLGTVIKATDYDLHRYGRHCFIIELNNQDDLHDVMARLDLPEGRTFPTCNKTLMVSHLFGIDENKQIPSVIKEAQWRHHMEVGGWEGRCI